ncbi:MAG: hypothetical protein HYS53_02650 [Candidatus Aenigmarchaeota archaeon]|nr:hypothetical protein [Candidatus Aenigmarchaeota archaeon]
MEWLRAAHRLLHREHLVWTMTPKANVAIALLAALFFLKSTTLYPQAGTLIYAGFLLGVSVGFFFGAYWHHAFSTHWNFYRRFYNAGTKAKDRLKMLAEKIDYEIPGYIAAVIFGFVLVYVSLSGFVWLSSGMFFGFIFGGSIALAIVLKYLE